MNRLSSIVRTCVGCVMPLLLAGCLAPPKHHPWEMSRDEAKQLHGVADWPQLSTNDYVRVSDAQIPTAVALLHDLPFVHLDAPRVASFAPNFPHESRPNLEPYLVRGASFSVPPAYTVVQFETTGKSLFIEQATYDGEMMMPFRWVADPDALVVWLPYRPEHVYPEALLGGDGIFRGGSGVDRR
jgi:hypothetical protein